VQAKHIIVSALSPSKDNSPLEAASARAEQLRVPVENVGRRVPGGDNYNIFTILSKPDQRRVEEDLENKAGRLGKEMQGQCKRVTCVSSYGWKFTMYYQEKKPAETLRNFASKVLGIDKAWIKLMSCGEATSDFTQISDYKLDMDAGINIVFAKKIQCVDMKGLSHEHHVNAEYTIGRLKEEMAKVENTNSDNISIVSTKERSKPLPDDMLLITIEGGRANFEVSRCDGMVAHADLPPKAAVVTRKSKIQSLNPSINQLKDLILRRLPKMLK